MKIVFLIIPLIFILYIAIFGLYLNYKLKRVNKVVDAIQFMLNKRFTYIERIISKIENKVDFEETTLKEVVQLRSQALKYKAEGDRRAEYFCEYKISQLINQIDRLMAEFNSLKNLSNKENLIQQLKEAEIQLDTLTDKYNKLIMRYNLIQTDNFFIIPLIIFRNCEKTFSEWPTS